MSEWILTDKTFALLLKHAIDHAQLVNTHNLTTDIDHDALTNFSADEHFAEGSIDHGAIQNVGSNTHAQIDTHVGDAGKHREINDAGSAATDLWSAEKIGTELGGKSDTGHDHDADYAPIAQGVTNGNDHDHEGGDGGVVSHSALSDHGSDDHTQYHNDTRGDARYLYRENAGAFTPDGDYEPATKKYVDDAVGTPVGFTSRARAYRSTSDQVISTATETKCELNAENYDGEDEFDSTTNYRFTAGSAGYYAVHAMITLEVITADKMIFLNLKKNGAAALTLYRYPGATEANASCWISDVIYMAASDYLEMFVYHTYGSDRNLVDHQAYTFLTVSRIA